jgi:signal transduction histidine kinase
MAIRAKLVIIFFLIIIAPMFLLWARWQGTALGGIKSVMRQGLGDRAREISDQVTSSLQEHRRRITSLTKEPGLLTYARAAAQSAPPVDEDLKTSLTAFLISHYKEYSALIIINRKGAPLYKLEPKEVNEVPRGALYSDDDFTSEDVVSAPEAFVAAKDQIFVSEVQQDMSGPHVKLIAPLRDAANNVTSALVIKLRAEELLTAAAGPHIPETADRYSPAAIILSPRGVVLYAADQAKQGRMYYEAFPELSDVFTSLLRGHKNGFDRDQWVFSHHLREDPPPKLSILMIGDYSKGAKQLEFDSYVLLLLTMLLVIVAMLALYYLVSEITGSIRRVTKGAKAIAMGNLTYQIKIKAKDETRVLAEAFNRMADRLREMIRKEGEQKQFESFARLSSVLTHDLKNQILSLSLLVNNMERKFDREGFKEDAMRTLSESVNNLQNLVAKLSDPRTPTKRFRERSNLSHLVERVVQRTAAQASGKFDVSSDLTPDIFIFVDGKAVERVVENLVINALEAMPDGGSLRVATWRENGSAFVAVADSGKGMTEEFMRERLFHPFATTKKKGIGLGLYSCRDIIEQHGGRIDVASRVNVGTEFKVILPLKAEELSTGDLKSAAVGSAPI